MVALCTRPVRSKIGHLSHAKNSASVQGAVVYLPQLVMYANPLARRFEVTSEPQREKGGRTP